jgi:hypothetical protein
MPTWTLVDTTQTPGWTGIVTGLTTVFEWNVFANLSFAEGCFADGSTGDAWELISTIQTPAWTQIST